MSTPDPNWPNINPHPQQPAQGGAPQDNTPTVPQAHPASPQFPPANLQNIPSQPVAAQPAHGQPVQPAQPIPVQPAQPFPAQAIPGQAIPRQPIPAQPIPVQPAFGQPAAGSAPTQVPSQPVPIQQIPVQNVQAAPAFPQSAQAVPVQRVPVQRVPVQPVPVQPVPVQPAPSTAQAGQPNPVQPQAVAVVQPGTFPVQTKNAAPRVKPTEQLTVRAPSPDDDDYEEPAPHVVKQAPPWLVSTIVHAVGLVILGLLVIASQNKPQIELTVDPTYAEELGEQLEDDTFDMALEQTDIVEPIFSEDVNPVDDPLAAPPDIPDVVLDATTQSSEIAAPSIGMALNGREKGMKKALLGAYGGNATTEAAVLRGLQWLKRNQRKDGSWSLKGAYTNGGMTENRSAATAMALLAFQGAGHTHRSGEFKATVAKGWDWLLKQQDPNGNFFREGAHHHTLYTQAQCTIAICELYGMTQDKNFRAPAQKALDYCNNAQNPVGGWRYAPKLDADTSVTGWFVMAMQSGLMAGLEVQSPTLDNIHRFLDTVTPDGGIQYSYKPGQATTPTMTAEALLCRQYLGWKHDDPRLLQGCDYVAQHPIDFADQNVYYWYYATQVNHHMDGKYWKKWNEVMRDVIPRAQVKTGTESGSWNPSDDRWGSHGGRLYTTCLSIYMLEIYYRHLPIYKYRLK